MKTKHTFAFTFIFGLVWTGILFAYSAGPDPGVNGVVAGVTCRQSGCHDSFALNSGTGSVNIGGLPTTWTPGQTYSLTVTVVGGSRYGFQFSAVNNSTNGQAGTLLAASPNDARVQFITGLGIQYAEHNSFANTSGTFNFRWTAPSSGSLGDVRFNVAGNATNNDGTSLGDRIYTRVVTVSPAVTDSTPPVISAVTSSSDITASAATITWTTDEASDTQVEFGPTPSYGQATTLNATLGTAHSATLPGLASNTTYHFRVKSRDAAGNLAAGPDSVFRTLFAISNLGGVSRSTDGSGSIEIGYGRIQPSVGSSTPAGIAIFGYSPSGILVTEAGVPDSPLITQGRIYAEVSSDLTVNTGLASVNTGLAMANPNAQDTRVDFQFRDTNGNLGPSGNFTLTGTATPCTPSETQICNQLSRFLHQAPYLAGTGIQGTLSFTSQLPISVIALRGFNNERVPYDFLITTLPVIDTTLVAPTGTRVIPHFVAGEGWTTQILLVNPTATDQTGTVQFLKADGSANTINVDGVAGSSGSYAVKANSSRKLLITGSVPGVASGSIRVVPAGGGAVPVPLVTFSYKAGPITTAETGVPVVMGTSFRMYGELTPASQIRTGLAIANATNTAGNVTISLTGLDGLPITASVTKPLPASGQIVAYLDDDDFFPSLKGQAVQGVIRISTADVSSISVVGLRLRYNERKPIPDFLMTTTPPTVESSTPSSTLRLFPHLANGSGFVMQFILYSGTSGQTAGGSLTFSKQDGTTLDLNIQ